MKQCGNAIEMFNVGQENIEFSHMHQPSSCKVDLGKRGLETAWPVAQQGLQVKYSSIDPHSKLDNFHSAIDLAHE